MADAQEKANLQDARNLYVEYLTTVDAQVEDVDGDKVEEVAVVIVKNEKTTYYLITDGSIAKVDSITDATAAAFASYDVKLQKGNDPVSGAKVSAQG